MTREEMQELAQEVLNNDDADTDDLLRALRKIAKG